MVEVTSKESSPPLIPMAAAFSDIFSENLQQLKGLNVTFGQADLRSGRSHDSRGIPSPLEKSLELLMRLE